MTSTGPFQRKEFYDRMILPDLPKQLLHTNICVEASTGVVDPD